MAFAEAGGLIGALGNGRSRRSVGGKTAARRPRSVVTCAGQVDGRTLDVIWTNPSARGSFGVVYFGKSALDGTEIVCKCPVESSLGRSLWSTERHVNEKLSQVEDDERYWPGFIGSTVVPRDASLPRGVAPIGLVWEKISLAQTMEDSLANGAGSLEQAMIRSQRMVVGGSAGVRVKLFKAVMKELLLAVEVMHRSGILHRDIKPENILISESSERPLQFIDFGSACDWSSWTKVGLGDATLDPTYAAPERKISIFAPNKFDVFSLGLLGLRLLLPALSSRLLFAEIVSGSLMEADYHVTSWALQMANQRDGSSLSRDCEQLSRRENRDVLQLLRGMLQKKTGDRFTVQDCLDSACLR